MRFVPTAGFVVSLGVVVFAGQQVPAPALTPARAPTAATSVGGHPEEGRPMIRAYQPLEIGGGNQTWSILQDRRGVMYFGTSGALLEFDGASWRRMTIGQGTVRAMAMDDTGRIWIGSVGQNRISRCRRTGREAVRLGGRQTARRHARVCGCLADLRHRRRGRVPDRASHLPLARRPDVGDPGRVPVRARVAAGRTRLRPDSGIGAGRAGGRHAQAGARHAAHRRRAVSGRPPLRRTPAARRHQARMGCSSTTAQR